MSATRQTEHQNRGADQLNAWANPVHDFDVGHRSFERERGRRADGTAGRAAGPPRWWRFSDRTSARTPYKLPWVQVERRRGECSYRRITLGSGHRGSWAGADRRRNRPLRVMRRPRRQASIATSARNVRRARSASRHDRSRQRSSAHRFEPRPALERTPRPQSRPRSGTASGKDQVNDEHREVRGDVAENEARRVLREERKAERQEERGVRLAELRETLGL
jgi:hypothetical protein